MKTSGKINNLFQRLSAAVMILALLWLTISAPFVFAAQQRVSGDHQAEKSANPLAGNEEETANPFGSAEKKASAGNSFSEEYLHDHSSDLHFILAGIRYQQCENADTYTAFHGELLVPPPNAA